MHKELAEKIVSPHESPDVGADEIRGIARDLLEALDTLEYISELPEQYPDDVMEMLKDVDAVEAVQVARDTLQGGEHGT